MRNLHLTFDCMYCSQKLGEDFTKFCGLLRIYELYLYQSKFLKHFYNLYAFYLWLKVLRLCCEMRFSERFWPIVSGNRRFLEIPLASCDIVYHSIRARWVSQLTNSFYNMDLLNQTFFENLTDVITNLLVKYVLWLT